VRSRSTAIFRESRERQAARAGLKLPPQPLSVAPKYRERLRAVNRNARARPEWLTGLYWKAVPVEAGPFFTLHGNTISTNPLDLILINSDAPVVVRVIGGSTVVN
jgi:hypothetical protein